MVITVSMPSGVEHNAPNVVVAAMEICDHRLDALGR